MNIILCLSVVSGSEETLIMDKIVNHWYHSIYRTINKTLMEVWSLQITTTLKFILIRHPSLICIIWSWDSNIHFLFISLQSVMIKILYTVYVHGISIIMDFIGQMNNCWELLTSSKCVITIGNQCTSLIPDYTRLALQMLYHWQIIFT